MTKIFSRDADLSGVSLDEGLFVQEMVQHVAVRVDNTDASTSQLSCKLYQLYLGTFGGVEFTLKDCDEFLWNNQIHTIQSASEIVAPFSRYAAALAKS